MGLKSRYESSQSRSGDLSLERNVEKFSRVGEEIRSSAAYKGCRRVERTRKVCVWEGMVQGRRKPRYG